MKAFYPGIDVSKGFADFMIIDCQKRPVVKGFQLDDTFDGHQSLYNILSQFLSEHPESTLFAGLESTGGYENNWYNSLIQFQGSLNIQTARLNPLGVMHNSKADLKKNTTDKSFPGIPSRELMVARLQVRRRLSRKVEGIKLVAPAKIQGDFDWNWIKINRFELNLPE